MTEIETQLLRIIEEQQQQLLQQQALLQRQQSTLDTVQTKIIETLSVQSKTIESDQQKLTASTEIISDNAEAISRARTQYSKLYRADQWKSPRDEQDYSEQQRITRENLQRTEDCTAELTRNLSNIEENYIQMMQRQQQKPKPEQDRGMDFGM